MMMTRNALNQCDLSPTRAPFYLGCLLALIAAALPISTALMNILFVTTAVLSFFYYRRQLAWRDLFRHPVFAAQVMLFMLLLMGILYSQADLSTAWHVLRKYSPLLLALAFIPIVQTGPWRYYALFGFLFTATCTLLLSYLKFYQLVPIHNPRIYRDTAIFKNHIETSFLTAFACYLCLRLAQYPHRAASLAWILAGLFAYNTLFMSPGKTGYIVLVALLMLWTVQGKGWRGLIIGSLGIGALLALAWWQSDSFAKHVGYLIAGIHNPNLAHNSLAVRWHFLQNSLHLFWQHPLIGGGTGSFAKQYASLTHTWQTTNPHNEYLNIAVQLGIVGLSALLALFIIPFYYAKTLEPLWRDLAQACVTIIAVGSFGNSWLMDTTEGHFFALFMVLCFAKMKNSKS